MGLLRCRAWCVRQNAGKSRIHPAWRAAALEGASCAQRHAARLPLLRPPGPVFSHSLRHRELTMRINHVNFARGFRGGERQTLNLMAGLARLGFVQTLICRTGSELKQRATALGFDVMETRHPL